MIVLCACKLFLLTGRLQILELHKNTKFECVCMPNLQPIGLCSQLNRVGLTDRRSPNSPQTDKID